MSDPVEFKWDKKLIIRDNKNGDKVLETFPEDKLERVKYANFLTKFLADQGYNKASGEKHNYVLNLNSEWGSGKTYFLRRWAEDLKEHYPVVYVDAWKQDYSDDPLMTVISSMIKQLREQAGSAEDKAIIKASRKLFGLLKAAAPSAARSLTKRYLGIDPVKIMEESEDNNQLGNAIDEDGNPIDMGLAASKVVEHLISEHDAKATAIESLKVNIEQWVATVIGKDQTQEVDEPKRTYPAFVFIDELDRCRPSYAVEMLETIKHIFNIPGVVFVVATDTGQLQHAVKAVYGEGFDARIYLSRFFSSRFSLKTPSFDNLLDVHCSTNLLAKEHLDERGIDIWNISDDLNETLNNITSVLNVFDLSVRSAIQTTERLISTVNNMGTGSTVDLISLLFLLCVREKNEIIYEHLIRGEINTQSKDDKDKVVNAFFRELFIDSDSQLTIHLKPKELTTTLRVANTSSTKNIYTDGKYQCSVGQYYHAIIKTIFYKASNLGGNKVEFNTNEFNESRKPQLESALNTLLKQLRDEGEVKGAGIYWTEYSYLHDKIGIKAKKGMYKDLVELASALDWIDGEDEA